MKSVSEMKARVNLLCQIIHNKVQAKKSVSVYSIRIYSPNVSFKS